MSATLTEDENGAAAIQLTNHVSNDSRVIQTVSVKPDTVYLLRADIRTSDVQYGTGANLSIDNFPIDGTYCYSENLFGTEGWRSVSLYFRTGAEQETVNAALRLGGYGTTATGTAEFRNVSLIESSAPEESIVNLATENGIVSFAGGTSESEQAPATANDPLYLALAFTLAIAAAIIWAYRNQLRYESNLMDSVGKPRLALMIILIGAFVFRVVLSLLFFGHPTDINCFMAWGNMVLDGTKTFYTSGGFADYPPGYMYICGALAALCKAVGISYGSDGMALLFKMPSTFADMITVYLLYRIALKTKLGEKGALLIAGVYAFCPPLMFVSGAWGQIDSLLALLIVLVFYLVQSDQRILAGAIYGLAILTKPQALMLGPILAVAYIADIATARDKWWKRLIETVLAVLAAVAVLLLLSLPFQGTQSWDWLIKKYAETAGSYQYASIEAFNFGSLIGGNWKSADMLVAGLVPYHLFGTIMIGLSVVFSSGLYLMGRKKNPGALYFSGALAVMLIFTFGHYMHERYMLPALLLLLMAFLYYRDRQLLIVFGGISITALLNATTAFYVVNHQAARGTVYNVITFVGSLADVLLAIYLCYICVQILARDQIAGLLKLQEERQKRLSRRTSILPRIPTDNKLHYTKRDMFVRTGYYAGLRHRRAHQPRFDKSAADLLGCKTGGGKRHREIPCRGACSRVQRFRQYR